MEHYDKRFYTLDKLSATSLWLIDDKLKKFLRDYSITEYPIDCFRLVDRIISSGKVPLEVMYVDGLSPALDAMAEYFPQIDAYCIVVNAKKKRSFAHSSGRRCNFTLAHEIGHIVLEHLLLPRLLKSNAQRAREDMEADEFAGRLLMPERMLLMSNFVSREAVAREYLVSEQALWKRVNNLKRLDLFGAGAKAACTNCGNADLSPAAEYCGICGNALDGSGKKGITTVAYPCPLTNAQQRVILCPICSNEEMLDGASFCRICGMSLYNRCCGSGHINPPNARFCEICGAQTAYANAGLLHSWKAERDEYIMAMTHR